MSKVTVIVPIYNVEQYVATCLDSLLRQTYIDFVVFAVNDGSPAKEQIIIDDYAKKYPDKIISIQKENGGYGSVLQLAIEKAESEYFLVCDPDDYLADDALERLVSLADQNQADLTVGAKYFIYSDGSDQDYDAAYNTQFTTLLAEHLYQKGTKEFENLYFIDPSPHAKLYRRTLATGIQFPHKIGFTDNLLFYISLLQAKRVVYTDYGCAYYLVDRVGNTMTDIKPQIIDAHTQVFCTILNQAQQCGQVEDLFYYRIFEAFKFTFYQLRRIKGTLEEKHQKGMVLYQLVEKLMKHRSAILSGLKQVGYTGKVERMKEKLILTPLLSRFVYKKWVLALVREEKQ